MKVLIVLSAVVAVSMAGYLPGGLAGISGYAAAPIAYSGAPVAYATAPLAYTSVVAPAALSEQHHAQDALGQYVYGYSDSNSIKGEYKTADGVTRGAYAYVDGNGEVQNVAYAADGAGFRVSASNLPKAPAVPETPALEAPKPVEDTPEVAAAKAAHQTAVSVAQAAAAAPAPAPAVVAAAPAVIAARGLIGALGLIAAPAGGFAYSSVAAAHGLGYSSIVGPSIGYSTFAGPAISYAAPALRFAAPAAPVVLTAQGVPVDTPEVQAARAADTAAHLRAKGLIY